MFKSADCDAFAIGSPWMHVLTLSTLDARSAAFPLLQPKPLRSHECPEVGAQRIGVLPRLVLRPAVERRLPEPRGVALAPIRLQRGAAAIIGLELRLEI